MNIAVDSSIPFASRLFTSAGNVSFLHHDEIIRENLKDTDILVTRSVTRIDRNLLEGTKVKVIASPTSGVDHVDREYLQTAGIEFVNAPGCNARSVAEYVLSCLFALRKAAKIELDKMKIGLVGCGHVGSCLSSMLQLTGLKHLLYDPPLQEKGDQRHFSSIREIQQADIISLHVPLSGQSPHSTHRMVDMKFLSALKPDVILINTARGDVIDEQALLHFLVEYGESKVVMDVWKNEPDINPDLLSHAIIATPHIAGYSLDARYNGTLEVFRRICKLTGLTCPEPEADVIPAVDDKQIIIPDGCDDMEVIQLAVLNGYDASLDSEKFKHRIDQNENTVGSHFIEFRKDYRTRREFSNFIVSLPESSKSVKQRLEYLGFNVNLQ